MATLEENINQAIADFDKIKEAIITKGVAVPYDTDTSEYGKLIKDIPNYDEGYEAGKKAQYDEFWDAIQGNGNRVDYGYGFYQWNCEYLRPKYKVIPTYRIISMFAYNKSLKIVEKQYFDFSNAPSSTTANTYGNYCVFAYCGSLEIIEDIGMKAGYYYDTFRNCPKLHTIERIPVTEECIFTTSCFHDLLSLKNIVIDGTIGRTITISRSPLTVESMKSIITHLKDYSGTDKEFTYKVTFSSACITALEAEGATSPNGNTWTEYLDDIGWLYS